MSKNHEIKYQWRDLVYDEKTWTNDFLPKINEIYEKEIVAVVNEQFLQLYENAYSEYENSLNKYKKEHNGFLYFVSIVALPFAFLLFFLPGYYLWKHFKSMKNNKMKLKNDIIEKEKALLQVHKQIINCFPPVRIFIRKIVKNILNYHHLGPISESLINTIQSLSMFNFNNNEEYNTFNTSWGIFNNNIVIYNAFQSHILGEMTYTGSVSVGYTRVVDGETRYETELVTATYVHPCPYYDGYGKLWCFSEYCDVLEFDYIRYYKGNAFSKKKKKHFALENRDFEKHYEWEWNDDNQIRMVFTPYLQELYLKICCDSEPPKYYQFCKYSSFFGTKFIFNNMNENSEIKKIIEKFASNVNYSLSDFIRDFLISAQKNVQTFYRAVSFMTIIPLIHSEDQINLINNVINGNDETNRLMTYHYVLTEILDEKIMKLDTQTVHSFPYQEQTINILPDIKLNKVNITAFAYKVNREVIYINAYSNHKGIVSVPVHYDDYVRYNQNGFLVFAKCSNQKYLYVTANDFCSDVDRSQLGILKLCIERIRSVCDFKKFVVLDGYLAFIANYDINLQNIAGDVEQIIKCLN